MIDRMATLSGAFNLLGASLIYGAIQERLGFLKLGLLEACRSRWSACCTS